MFKCAILSIGSEILNGYIFDTNTTYTAKKLFEAGYSVERTESVKDDVEVISKSLQELSLFYHIIIATGGLVPTFDDMITEACTKLLNIRVKLDKNLH